MKDIVLRSPNSDVSDVALTLDVPLACGGGQAEIYEHPNDRHTLIKIWLDGRSEKQRKLARLLEQPPEPHQPWFKIATPTCSVVDQASDEVIGFAMPKIPGKELSELLSTQMQPIYWQPYERRLGLARRIAAAVDDVHSQGFCIVDLKPDNALVHNENVSFVDVDNWQIDGEFTAWGTSPEYAPPEAYGQIDQRHVEKSFDSWALAILIFQILLLDHPFAATQKPGAQRLSLRYRMVQGLWPWSPEAARRGISPKPRVRLELLPSAVRQLIEDTLVLGHSAPAKRATPQAFAASLEQALQDKAFLADIPTLMKQTVRATSYKASPDPIAAPAKPQRTNDTVVRSTLASFGYRALRWAAAASLAVVVLGVLSFAAFQVAGSVSLRPIVAEDVHLSADDRGLPFPRLCEPLEVEP